MFDVFFPLHRGNDTGMFLEVDQPLKAVGFGKTLDGSFAMFPDTSDQVGRHADIQRAIWPVGHDVDPAIHAVRVPWSKPAGDSINAQ